MLVEVVPWCSQTTAKIPDPMLIDACICVALYVVHMISFKKHCDWLMWLIDWCDWLMWLIDVIDWCDWLIGWVSEWVREWVSEWMSEWVSEWVADREHTDALHHITPWYLPGSHTNCYGKTWRPLCPFFRNLHLRDKQRVLTPGHQGWNDLHSLCRIGMQYYLLNGKK